MSIESPKENLSLTHEVFTSLSAIQSAAEILSSLDLASDTDKTGEYLRMIIRNSSRLEKALHTLLSRIEKSSKN